MLSRWFILGLVAFSFLLPTQQVVAAKKRVFSRSFVSGRGYSSARLSRATNSVVVTFLNLGRVQKISYELSYSAQGIPQGVIGSMIPSGQTTDSRDLYFGTCSKGVCTPHYGISGAVLVVTTQLTSGGTTVKRYRIKV
ncbi:hypothetical protein HY086_03145 [Candidatus Gottesmanbacteria bacterium]|nr:hypothetical protein [Candidatus Gottesmanbacteria bacterium]